MSVYGAGSNPVGANQLLVGVVLSSCSGRYHYSLGRLGLENSGQGEVDSGPRYSP